VGDPAALRGARRARKSSFKSRRRVQLVAADAAHARREAREAEALHRSMASYYYCEEQREPHCQRAAGPRQYGGRHIKAGRIPALFFLLFFNAPLASESCHGICVVYV